MRFDQPVPPGGYRWWYLDALSDDGRFGCTIIAFIGSVFSPYYARRPAADPTHHVAMNVALYGLRGPGWAMTERGATALTRTPDLLSIGPSHMRWHNNTLTIALDEITVPLPRRLRGTITVIPGPLFGAEHAIDSHGDHRWSPLAPCARATIAFDRPHWHWSGHAYLDTNHGNAPLATAFKSWDWSRATLPDGSTAVLYDATLRDTSRCALGLHFHPDGTSTPITVPPRHALPNGLWQMHSTAHGTTPSLHRRLENAPFYTRSLVNTDILGHSVTAFHESLSLDRFRQPWVQMLLPFRMPRRTGAGGDCLGVAQDGRPGLCPGPAGAERPQTPSIREGEEGPARTVTTD